MRLISKWRLNGTKHHLLFFSTSHSTGWVELQDTQTGKYTNETPVWKASCFQPRPSLTWTPRLLTLRKYLQVEWNPVYFGRSCERPGGRTSGNRQRPCCHKAHGGLGDTHTHTKRQKDTHTHTHTWTEVENTFKVWLDGSVKSGESEKWWTFIPRGSEQ